METPYIYDDESDNKIELPWVWQICPYCAGRGYSVLHGMAIDPSDWDDESLDEYFHGKAYHTECEGQCDNGKVREVNRMTCDPAQLAEYDDLQQQMWEARAEQAAERAMGA